MRYGFIGLGNLGRHLAASLLRGGFDLTVHDLNRDAARDLIQRGAKWADSPKELAAAVDAVITCLPSPSASSTVLTADNGVLNGLRSGGTWIEMSTTDQNEIARISKLAAERGIATLEAPVTGGVHRAAAGEITVLVGGDRAVYEAHRAALQAGLSPAIADAIAQGKRPTGMQPDEEVVYNFCTEMLTTKQVSDATFKAVKDAMGERGVVDLVGVMGWYQTVSMLLNVDRYPLPEGTQAELKPLK